MKIQDFNAFEKRKNWIEMGETAQSIISLSVENNQLAHICNCTSTKEM